MNKTLIQLLPGQTLTLRDYVAEFQQHFWTMDKSLCWKIERQQEFAEPGDDSWEAFAKGDWTEALRLMHAKRHEIAQYHKRIQEHGFDVRRIRIVQEPISAYLIWELNVLHIRAECGASIRVIDVRHAQAFEHAGVAPEIFILGESIAYQVLYSGDGVAEGAIRITDSTIIANWTEAAKQLYAAGEELDSYFRRKVEGLQPKVARGCR